MFEVEEEEESDIEYIREAAAAAVSEIVPDKSRDRYEKAYKTFEDWCKLKKVKEPTEDVLLAYFAEMAKSFKPSTLWSMYSMIKSMLSLKKNLNISKFSKLSAYLKRKSAEYQPKKSRAFSRVEIDRFLLEAPNKEFLMMKVVLIMGLAGGCRCDELTKMSLDDIEDANTMLIVRIPDTKTNKPRRFVVADDGNSQRNLTLYKKYVALRPPHTPHQRLFISYRQGKCTIQPVGLHMFGKIPSKIAIFLGLPKVKEYTGHCLRRSSATLLVDAGGDLTCLKRHGGWRSSSVAEGYIEDSLENKVAIANRINGGNNKEETSKINHVVSSTSEMSSSEISEESAAGRVDVKTALAGINISNVENITININNH